MATISKIGHTHAREHSPTKDGKPALLADVGVRYETIESRDTATFFPRRRTVRDSLLERPGRRQVKKKAPKIPRPTKALTVGTGRVGKTEAQAIM